MLDGEGNVTNKIVDGAVNGVAFHSGVMAISSPNEFVVRSGLDSTNDIHSPVPLGTHGVIGLKSKFFASPAGWSGLILAPADDSEMKEFTIYQDDATPANFYRTVVFPSDGRDRLISAVRNDGILLSELTDSLSSTLIRFTGERLPDIIDVCALGIDSGFVALSKDGRIFFFDNLTGRTNPISMKFDKLRGIGYRIAAVQGGIAVLTSRGLYFFDNLAKQFRSQHRSPKRVRDYPLEGIDLAVIADRWLIVTLTDGALKIDMQKVLRIEGSAVDFHPQINWNEPADWTSKHYSPHQSSGLASSRT